MTLTKEWLLKTIAELEEERDAIPGAVNEEAAMKLAAMKLALASLEVEDSFEPVAFINGAWTLVCYRPPKELGLKIGDKLYAATPAPVSVPTFEEWCVRTEQKPVGWVRDAMKEAYDACRAAMLQGADGTSPVIPDGWVLVPKEPTPAMLNAAWVSHGIYHASAYRTMLAAAPQLEV